MTLPLMNIQKILLLFLIISIVAGLDTKNLVPVLCFLVSLHGVIPPSGWYSNIVVSYESMKRIPSITGVGA